MSDEAGWEYESQSAESGERIMLPRLGAHLSVWGSGHVCDADGPHAGPCICECGLQQPWDGP